MSKCPSCGYWAFNGVECFDCGYRRRRRILTIVVALVGAATLIPVAAQSPVPGWVQVGDNLVPCDHQIAIYAGKGCVAPAPTTPTAPPPVSPILARTGASYQHKVAGWRLYVIGPVQRANGLVVILAEVTQGRDHLGRELFRNGDLFEISGQFSAAEWQEVRASAR